MKTRFYVTYAVIDQCVIDDDEVLLADPDQYGTRADAERAAREAAKECGGSFRVMKITREILKPRAAIAAAKGTR